MTGAVDSKNERYTIEARIGSGAMATVYRAYDQRLHRIVALKILHEHLSSNSELRLRFEQEAKLAARIDHPNVVRIYDIGINSQNQLFIVSEFIDGRSLTLALRQYSNQLTPYLNPALAALVGQEIARGMEAAHRHSVVHRDLKPDNVLVSNNGEVKLTDFGVARPFDSSMTQAGQFIGSLTYASPEQVHGGKIDARSDIFSYGVILFELLTGQLPFRSTNPTDLAVKISQAQIPPLNQIRASIPIELDSLVRKCLRAAPADRPQSAEHIVRELSTFLSRNEVISSPHSIRDGFENPALFSSTIRRADLSTGRANEVTHISPAPKIGTAANPLDVVADEPSLAVATTEQMSGQSTAQSPGVAGSPVVRSVPQRQPSMERKIQRPPHERTPTTRNSSQKSSGILFPLFIFAMIVAFSSLVFFREREEVQAVITQIREAFSSFRVHFNENKTQITEQTVSSLEPMPPSEVAKPQATPNPIPTRTEPIAKPTKSKVESTPKPVENRILPQPTKAPTLAAPPRKTPAQNPVAKSRPQTAPIKQNKDNAKAKQPAAAVNSASTASKQKSSEMLKATLQVQTQPGPRTLDIIRAGRREFLGLSARGNSVRVFQSLEPGVVTLFIPAEEVDGRRYESFQKQLKLEPGKILKLPSISSRALTNIVIRCSADVRITKINARKVLHRGGALTFEAAINSSLEVETQLKTGQQNSMRLEVRQDGQSFACPGESKKEN